MGGQSDFDQYRVPSSLIFFPSVKQNCIYFQCRSVQFSASLLPWVKYKDVCGMRFGDEKMHTTFP